MLIKRRPPQFTSFVENKYRHEHVMIINLYIVSNILYDRHPYECILWGFLCMLKRSQWLYPVPSWNTLPLLNQLVFKFRKCGSWEGIRSCISRPRISQGWPIVDGSGLVRPVKGVGHNQLTNSSLPYCRYAGIVLLEEKIASNRLINFQDMWVEDFIYIVLACKWPPNYYAN